ncbi:MAG: sialate O-acetylesterase [Pseudomonadota bacterium]
MTVGSDARRSGPYSGDGVSTTFTVTFAFFASADLGVFRLGADGNETKLVLGADYTVAATTDSNGDPNGGSVTLTTPLASGQTLTIIRDLSLTQLTEFVEGARFPAETNERALDRLTQGLQQLQEQTERAVLLAVNTQTASVVLPEPNAGSPLGWDANGDLVNLTQTGSDRGDFVSGTAYFSGDIYTDPATQDIYSVLIAHTGTNIPADTMAGNVRRLLDLSTATQAVTDATTQATAAAGSATAAAGSASAASSSASAAALSAANAVAEASAAATSEANAGNSETNAAASATAASTAVGDAQAAQTAAEAARNLAQQWATNPEDSVVPGTSSFSALHHAAKAADSAANAAAEAADARAADISASAAAVSAGLSASAAAASAAAAGAGSLADRIILAAGQSNMVGSGSPDGGADETIDVPHPQILAFPSPASGPGQSGVLRMEGPGFTSPFGPPARYYSPAFSYCLSRIGELRPGERFIVVQCALVGAAVGTGSYWDPAAASGGFQDVQDALAAVAAAFPDAEPEAILWCQGEANAATAKATYKADLAAGITRIRANAGWSTIPFLMLSVVPGFAAATPGLSDIVDAQRETALEVANTAFVSGGFGSNTAGHYLTGEQRANGRRLADVLRRLPRFDSAVPATPPLPTIADTNLTVVSPEGAQEFAIEYREDGTAGAFTRIDTLETADPVAPGLSVTLDIGALPSAAAQEVRVAGRNRVGAGGFSPSAIYQPAAFQSPTVNMDPQNPGSTAASIVDSANGGAWASEAAAGGTLVTVDGFQQVNVGSNDVYAYNALLNALASGNVTISMLFFQTGDAIGPGAFDTSMLGSTSGSVVNNLIMRTALQPGRQDEPHYFERNTRLFLGRAHFTQRTYQALTVSVDRSAGVGGTGTARMYLSKLAGIEETFTLDTPTPSYRPRVNAALIDQQNLGRGLPMRIGAIRLFDSVLTPAQIALLHNSYESEFGITLGTAALLP